MAAERANYYFRWLCKGACPVIQVILSKVPQKPKSPKFIESIVLLDIRRDELDPIERMCWGTTGERREKMTGLHPAGALYFVTT